MTLQIIDNEYAIVATTKSTFAGAASIKCRFLEHLDRLGYDVTLIAESTPPEYERLNSRYEVIHIDSSDIRSASKGAKELLFNFLVERIVKESELHHSKGKRLILWGSHLFPYGSACVTAKEILSKKGIQPSLILFPVGADIWEIGHATPTVLRHVLNSESVDVVATYSRQFSAEVAGYLNTTRRIHCVTPFLVDRSFAPIAMPQKLIRRKQLGLEPQSLVLINHSNMRPIKRIDFTISLANRIAEKISPRRCHLLLIGPLLERFPARSLCVKLHQIATKRNVAYYLPIADYNINTSLHDSFNTALLESLASGVPTITSDRPAIAKSIKKSDAGFVFKTKTCLQSVMAEIEGDYPISESAVDKIVNNVAKLSEIQYRRMSERARSLAAGEFSEKAGSRRLLRLIRTASCYGS